MKKIENIKKQIKILFICQIILVIVGVILPGGGIFPLEFFLIGLSLLVCPYIFLLGSIFLYKKGTGDTLTYLAIATNFLIVLGYVILSLLMAFYDLEWMDIGSKLSPFWGREDHL